MNGVALASSGTVDATSALASTRAWVVPAPIHERVAVDARCPAARRCGRCRRGGRTRRAAAPASGRGSDRRRAPSRSSPSSARSCAASATVSGAWYSNGAGFTGDQSARCLARGGRRPSRTASSTSPMTQVMPRIASSRSSSQSTHQPLVRRDGPEHVEHRRRQRAVFSRPSASHTPPRQRAAPPAGAGSRR